jgi:DNA-binding response OmpR family regulator
MATQAITDRHTLLVVDDEPDLLDSIRDLARIEFRVLTSGNPWEALRMVEEHDVHIILADVRMPAMNGVDLLTRARHIRPETIRLVFTGYSDVGAVIAAINEGQIFRYVNKSCTSEELLMILRQAGEYHALTRERRKLMEQLQEFTVLLQSANQELEEKNARLQELTTQLVEANAVLLKSLKKEKGRLGHYQILEKLGQGGMGTVYKALHIHLMKLVALKVLAPERMDDAEAVARFRREMKVIGQLNHPSIVQASDAGEADGSYFLVMEFVDGIAVSDLIARQGVLSIPDACELVSQAATGLQHAHEYGLIHRDIKPSNLMLTAGGSVKVLDFGLARLCGEDPSCGRLTKHGQVMGTVDYIAPEQARGTHPIDIRADLYGLGCTIYHLLAGYAPFSRPGQEMSGMEKLMAHIQADVLPIQEIRPELPRGLAELLDRLLAKNPAQRPSSPSELVADLQPFIIGSDLRRLAALVEPVGTDVPETRFEDIDPA